MSFSKRLVLFFLLTEIIQLMMFIRHCLQELNLQVLLRHKCNSHFERFIKCSLQTDLASACGSYLQKKKELLLIWHFIISPPLEWDMLQEIKEHQAGICLGFEIPSKSSLVWFYDSGGYKHISTAFLKPKKGLLRRHLHPSITQSQESRTLSWGCFLKDVNKFSTEFQTEEEKEENSNVDFPS